ncbi:unnamed protein product, partial [Fusarium fujikuroi]
WPVALSETHSRVPELEANLWHGFDPGPVQPPHLDVGAMGGITPWSAMPQSNACSPIASTSSHDPHSQSLWSTQTADDILVSHQGTSYIREHGAFWFRPLSHYIYRSCCSATEWPVKSFATGSKVFKEVLKLLNPLKGQQPSSLVTRVGC